VELEAPRAVQPAAGQLVEPAAAERRPVQRVEEAAEAEERQAVRAAPEVRAAKLLLATGASERLHNLANPL